MNIKTYLLTYYITSPLQKVLNKSGHKPIKTWVNKGTEFYKRSMNSWLQDNAEIYSIHNKEKSVTERFIWTSKNKIYTYMS